MRIDYLSQLIPSPKTNAIFSSEHLIAHMIAIECAYLSAIGGDAATYTNFAPDFAALKDAMARDGVIIPELVRQMRAHHDDPLLHKGMTSQDVMDTATMMAIGEVNNAFAPLLLDALAKLDALLNQYGENTIMARTRMQAALPIAASKRIANWREPLRVIQGALAHLRERIEILSLGGPVGDNRHWGEARDEIAAHMASELGLHPARNWHTDRTPIMDYGNWLVKLTGHLGKIGQDITLMAQQGIDEIKLAGGGGSSAMAHKSNPVKAELLITLGRYNAAQIGGLHQAMIHEQERSGTAWALEWLILPEMIGTGEASLETLNQLLHQIEAIGQP